MNTLCLQKKDFADSTCPITGFISQGSKTHPNGSIVEALINYGQKYPFNPYDYYEDPQALTLDQLQEHPIVIDTDPWYSRTVGEDSKNPVYKDDPNYGEKLIKSLFKGEKGYQRTLPEPGITHMIITDDRQMLEDKMYEFIPAGTMCLNGGPYGTKQFCDEIHKGRLSSFSVIKLPFSLSKVPFPSTIMFLHDRLSMYKLPSLCV